jgi:hypothetical protein
MVEKRMPDAKLKAVSHLICRYFENDRRNEEEELNKPRKLENKNSKSSDSNIKKSI